MQLSLALIFIFAVIEFFIATCAAMGVSFTSAARSSNAFRQSVLFGVHDSWPWSQFNFLPFVIWKKKNLSKQLS